MDKKTNLRLIELRDIYVSMQQLIEARHKFMAQSMKEYDLTVADPERERLRKRCAKTGHGDTKTLFLGGDNHYEIRCKICGSIIRTNKPS